ncbi:hypothetical protein RA307_16860 [Xanthobacteraceae bacterium Astr-EGSB]|uniref:hypothetical protein n=1 Tax=Astrobacterium formosum TaxID=3069710 RepID=UPI0027B6D087|nr:hypothetical protein [Xanthobacteraceae bacterium Astr-EGSB]
MRASVRVSASAVSVGVAMVLGSLAAMADGLDRAACAARAEDRPDAVLSVRGRVDFGWMAEAEHFAGRPAVAPYTVRIIARDGPRSLVAHDRLVLPGLPSEWITVTRAADLVLCSRRLPATVVIARQFCTAQVSAGDIANSEIEEITFLGGVTWLADDLFAEAGIAEAGSAQADGRVPAEIVDELRHDVAMASPAGHARDPDQPHVIVYAPQVAQSVAAWSVVPMSEVLQQDAGVPAACLVRHADLRRGIVPARRLGR